MQISTSHNEARLNGSRAYIDNGSGVAKIQVFATSQPSFGGAAGADPLVEILLPNPCGTVADNALTFASTEDALILNSGVAVWGRMLTRSGAIACDGTISDMAGSGDFKLLTTSLIAGGVTRLVSGAFR